MAKDTGTAPAPRPADESAQRGARRPRGRGQDHARRGPARRHRRAAAGRPGRGRHHLPRHRGGGDPPAALGVARRGHRRARRAPLTLLDTPGSPGLRRRAAGRPAGRRRGAVRRLGGQRRRRRDRAAVGGVRRRRACRGPSSSPSSTGPAPTSTRPSGSARCCSGRASTRCTWSTAAPDGAVRGLVSLLEPRRPTAPGGRPAPLRADRGDHRRERGRGAHGALPRRRRAGRRPTSSPTWRPRSPAGTSTRCSAPPR